MDTIFAEATAPGKAGVAIIRVSGPQAFAAGRTIAGDLPEPRRAALRALKGMRGEVLDQAVVLTFTAHASFTGEDVVEFQVHGSRAVCQALKEVLSTLPNLRAAEAGEFTRRALENDRLDLTQVEGLADLIDAETDLQRRQAQAVLSGSLSSKVLVWRDKLIQAAALIEASLDFADEDVPVDVLPEVSRSISDVLQDLEYEVAGFRAADRIRSGFEVAILGPPNAGKSTLMNAIARRDVALTSSIAGTTRDIIEVHIDLNGMPVSFLDTAGLRASIDPLESAGIERALDRGNAADLRVFLSATDTQLGVTRQKDDIEVAGKSDLGAGDVSGLTGEGVDDLLGKIHSILSQRIGATSSITRERHVIAMKDASRFLLEAESAIEIGTNFELVAEPLRNSIRSLESLIGRVDVEDLLGDIFSRFCIGK